MYIFIQVEPGYQGGAREGPFQERVMEGSRVYWKNIRPMPINYLRASLPLIKPVTVSHFPMRLQPFETM